MLDVKVYADIGVVETGTPPEGSETQLFKKEANLTPVEYVNGALAGQAEWYYEQVITFGPSGTQSFNLFSGGLVDANGNVIAAAAVKGIMIDTRPYAATNVGNVIDEGGSGNPFVGPLAGTTPSIAVDPGGVYLQASITGWAVSSGANSLKLANSSSAAGATQFILKMWGN